MGLRRNVDLTERPDEAFCREPQVKCSHDGCEFSVPLSLIVTASLYCPPLITLAERLGFGRVADMTHEDIYHSLLCEEHYGKPSISIKDALMEFAQAREKERHVKEAIAAGKILRCDNAACELKVTAPDEVKLTWFAPSMQLLRRMTRKKPKELTSTDVKQEAICPRCMGLLRKQNPAAAAEYLPLFRALENLRNHGKSPVQPLQSRGDNKIIHISIDSRVQSSRRAPSTEAQSRRR